MRIDELMFSTNSISIFDKNGNRIEEIKLKEKIKPVPRRRCGISEKGIYYKGAGIIYTGHFVNSYDDSVKLVSKTESIYEKYNVVYPALYRKHGIFTFQHQPVFSDFEGACGKKEKNIILMQKTFQLSAIEEIIDVIETPLNDHFIYKYRLKDIQGSYKDTINLIEYIMSENYNTAWDKNVWDDIRCFGYVRDLADWFVSAEFKHKIGTIYALLSAILKKDKYLYEIVVRNLTNLEQLSDHHIIFIAAQIVKKFSNSCMPNIDLSIPDANTYSFLWNELYAGKACCHLENENNWKDIRIIFKDRIPSQVSLAMKDLYYHRIMTLLSKK